MLTEAYELDVTETDAGRVRVVGGRVPPTPPKTLSPEQFDRLLEHVDPRGRLLVLLLRWTGLRIAEALGVRWGDLTDGGDGHVLVVRRQWQDGRFVTPTKTAAGRRSVALVPSLHGALLDARAHARDHHSYVLSSIA